MIDVRNDDSKGLHHPTTRLTTRYFKGYVL
jgi:hypothetical protein